MTRPGDDDEPLVLGPEYFLADDEAPGELPKARIIEVNIEAEPAPDNVADDRVASDADNLVDDAVDNLVEGSGSQTQNLRRIYELELKPLTRDERLAEAHRADAARLLAFCLDPDPQVINAVFENASAGLAHARMVAKHHASSVGLEMIAKRAQFLRDTQVQRALLQNAQTSESILRRMLGLRPLRDVYKACIDRELPSKNRALVRTLLRARFTQAQGEERASLIVSTEGRCLSLLIGQNFGQQATSLLCSRRYNSVIFIRNLAHFAACPPLLLAHLLKQPFVRRQPHLRRLLTQHPNMPAQLKR